MFSPFCFRSVGAWWESYLSCWSVGFHSARRLLWSSIGSSFCAGSASSQACGSVSARLASPLILTELLRLSFLLMSAFSLLAPSFCSRWTRCSARTASLSSRLAGRAVRAAQQARAVAPTTPRPPPCSRLSSASSRRLRRAGLAGLCIFLRTSLCPSRTAASLCGGMSSVCAAFWAIRMLCSALLRWVRLPRAAARGGRTFPCLERCRGWVPGSLSLPFSTPAAAPAMVACSRPPP